VVSDGTLGGVAVALGWDRARARAAANLSARWGGARTRGGEGGELRARGGRGSGVGLAVVLHSSNTTIARPRIGFGMSSPRRVQVARVAALACSVCLAGFVILHAQFGCGAEPTASPAEDQNDDVGSNADSVLLPLRRADPHTFPRRRVGQAEHPAAKTEPEATPSGNAPSGNAEGGRAPTLMPASKSMGDFSRLPLPGEAEPGEAEPGEAEPGEAK